MPRALAISCDYLDCELLRKEWSWLVPDDHFPLMIGAFGDWVFGAPDGSFYVLCLFEGDYRQVARSSYEFNNLKRDDDILNDWFKADWVMIAAGNNIIPDDD